MLPATLVTLTTFLLKLCSSSPVYNMQPAFITNTVGATTGRNIRNLPCISRKNSNQSGFCMFAIDCLKANGTHLGTCIDGFYFGSCCHIEPVRDILDNTIDTDIIPHREPPYRISSTTMKTTKITTVAPKNESTTLKISLNKNTTEKTTIGQNIITVSIKPIPVANVSTSQTTISSTAVPQKLQTFQVVEGNTLEEVSTKASTLFTTNGILEANKRPITKKPILESTTKIPVTKEPITYGSSTSSFISPEITTSKPVNFSLPTPNSTTTEKFTNSTKSSTASALTEKTTKPTKSTSKPSKYSSKPTKVTTTRKPDFTTTKRQTAKPTKSQTTTKPTKKPSASSKPTKKVTTTSKVPIRKTTIKITSTTEKINTKPTLNVSTTLLPTSKPQTTFSSTTEKIASVLNSTKSPITQSVITTPISNILNKVNATQILETVNGNLATNEIDTDHKPTTNKPGLITWSVVDNRNVTTLAPDAIDVNVTTEDWVPITTPDGWVLLPSVGTVLNGSSVDNITPLPSPIPSNSSEQELGTTPSPSSTSLFINATTSPSTIRPVTQTPTGDILSIEVNATVNMTISTSSTTSSYVTNENEISSSGSAAISEVYPMPPVEPMDRPFNMSDYTDVCGRRMVPMEPEARIVGGDKSAFGKWPWQISLRQWRTSTYLHKCGAALLNENWAITAAHCVDNVPPSDLLLRLGEHDLSTESEPYLHQERRVQIVASHPQFDPRTFEYDLALLRFYEPVNFQPNILPVCVPKADENFVGRTAHVTGWGRLYEDGPLPSILQEVSVPVINNTVCESMYRAAGYIEHIPHIFICAGWRQGGFDSCEGDSGGPMVIQRPDKRFLLAGVISWGIGCAEPDQPGVYTRISEFRDWINQILQF